MIYLTAMSSIHFQHNRAKKGHVDTFTINPKCVKLGELYGETNPVTFEWTDGLIASATRKFAKSVQSVPPGEDGRDSRPETSMTAVSEALTQVNTIEWVSHITMCHCQVDDVK